LLSSPLGPNSPPSHHLLHSYLVKKKEKANVAIGAKEAAKEAVSRLGTLASR
jgi:hypothetical protein